MRVSLFILCEFGVENIEIACLVFFFFSEMYIACFCVHKSMHVCVCICVCFLHFVKARFSYASFSYIYDRVHPFRMNR